MYLRDESEMMFIEWKTNYALEHDLFESRRKQRFFRVNSEKFDLLRPNFVITHSNIQSNIRMSKSGL